MSSMEKEWERETGGWREGVTDWVEKGGTNWKAYSEDGSMREQEKGEEERGELASLCLSTEGDTLERGKGMI